MVDGRPLSWSLTPNTANAHTNAHSYSLDWIRWFNNSITKSIHRASTGSNRWAWSSPPSMGCGSVRPAGFCAARHNASHVTRCRRLNRYAGLSHSWGTCIRAKNIKIRWYGSMWRSNSACSCIYACNGFDGMLCMSVRAASIRNKCPVCLVILWLLLATPNMASHITRAVASGPSASSAGVSIHIRNCLGVWPCK